MASSPKKKKLSQRKLSGATSYACSVKEFRCNVCSYNVSCSHQGETDLKCHCDGANHIKRQKALENTRSLCSFGFTKSTDPLRVQVRCWGLDSRLGKCTQRSVKLLKFQENLCYKNFSIYIIFIWLSFSYLWQILW